MTKPAPMPIDVVSDVVCPWCFIGKRRLEKALALKPEISVEVRWRPYFLNDWVPPEGISREQYLTAKFGSVDRYAGIAQRVAAACAEEGLTYAVDKIARQPNTTDCHRLITWAGNAGNAAAMKQKLMDLYFTEGADLSDREVLVKAAADCGMEEKSVREMLASEKDVDSIAEEVNAAKQAGVDGVPCFIFGGVLAVSGAQAPDYLAGAIEKAAEEYRKRAETDQAAARQRPY